MNLPTSVEERVNISKQVTCLVNIVHVHVVGESRRKASFAGFSRTWCQHERGGVASRSSRMPFRVERS
jgi:hypothetical protein